MSRTLAANNRTWSSSADEYATAEDFQRLFDSHAVDLFRLAFLLTADAAKAEQCMIATLRECRSNDSVFKDWLSVWTRRALIRNAIEIVTGRSAYLTESAAQHESFSAFHRAEGSTAGPPSESAGVLHLHDFDRLVYVMSVLERYPIQDCATLLGKSPQEVRDAQHRALNQIVAYETQRHRALENHRQILAAQTHENAINFDRRATG